jgi:hypothetical protein
MILTPLFLVLIFLPITVMRVSSLPKSRFRHAEGSDLNYVVDVLLAAMPDDPAWIYRYPYRHEYPKDHRHFSKLLLEFFIDPKNDDWTIMIVESPTAGDSAEWSIRAFAVWDISYINLRKHPSHAPQDRESACEI